MPARSGARVDFRNPITARLGAAAALSTQFVDATLEYHAGGGQNDLRESAPWTDRTGNARQGLFATFFSEGGPLASRGIVFYHTVSYGIYLETRFSGRFRVIMPVVTRTGRKVMRTLRGLMRAI